MSARPAVTCESCSELLLPLLCEELDADTAAEVRAHALTCERCSATLGKLERTMALSRELPLLTPSPEVEQRIMQAARAAVAGKAKGPAREAPSSHSGSTIGAWFARLGTWAMSPQVAMASVLLLVVGIGLYALPLGQTPETTALRATEEDVPTEPRPAAAPAASATATPVPADTDMARPRDRSEGASEEREPLGATSPQKRAAAKPTFKGDSKPMARKQAAPAGAADDADYGAPSAVVGRRPQPEARAKSAASAEETSAPSLQGGSASSASRASNFAPAPPSPASSPKREVPSEADDEGEVESKRGDLLAQGIVAAQRGNYPLAESMLLPITKSGTPAERAKANLWLARSLRAQGDCARALTFYRPLTQALSADPSVLTEAADCYERTGNPVQANKLRARVKAPSKTGSAK